MDFETLFGICNLECGIYNGCMAELKLGKYKHFKGFEVEVIGLARHSETLEELVVYKELRDNGEFGYGALWVRPKQMFMENVERDGKVMPRFEFIGE